MLYNRESFLANNKNIMQPRNFSTANDLHYTVHNHPQYISHKHRHITTIKYNFEWDHYIAASHWDTNLHKDTDF